MGVKDRDGLRHPRGSSPQVAESGRVTSAPPAPGTSADAAAVLDSPDLAARIRARDPDALRAVVSAYLPQVVRAARGAGFSRDRAEDVAQSTFVTFLESASRFEGRSHVRTWLFGILYKKIAEARRDVAREREVDDIDDVVRARFDESGGWTAPPRPTDARLRDREIREGVTDCLEQAPSAQRMAFVLREVEQLATEEICKILHVTRTNLGVMLYRIRNRLRECLEARGIRE